MRNEKIFLSAVSSQFLACRNVLASDLRAIGHVVKVQEDFQQGPGSLIERLEEYVASCDRVIALVGDAYGFEASGDAVPAVDPPRSYTQWEYYFAIGERLNGATVPPKDLLVYCASTAFLQTYPADQSSEQAERQRQFVEYIKRSGKHRAPCDSLDQVCRSVLRDGWQLQERPKLRPPPFQLPSRALAGTLFGREALVTELTRRLRRSESVDVWGPAGMGKTALAAEAILEVVGSTPAELAASPYPDGVVLLDLYRGKFGAVESAWNALADAFDPDVPNTLPPRERAQRACHGRRALVVVEGAEEAGDGARLQELLAVMDPETTRLVLTRNKAQSAAPKPLSVEEDLLPDDALALLRELAEGAADDACLRGFLNCLGGHPLALTWAGRQLAAREEAPEAFLTALATAPLPDLHQPGDEHCGLKWLFGRSLRHVGDAARRVLGGVGCLAFQPFSVSAVQAALAEDGADEAAARAALRPLVRHGLLRLGTSGDERWTFSHALAHQFARSEPRDPKMLKDMGDWAIAEFDRAVARVRADGDFAPLTQALGHAGALLRADRDAEVLDGLAVKLRYDGRDRIRELGRLDLALTATTADQHWLSAAPGERRTQPDWQRELAASHDSIGNVRVAQGDGRGALSAYRNSLAIREALAAHDPAYTEWQRDLSISHNKIGEVRVAQGDGPGALAAYRKGLAIAEALAVRDPANTEWQRDLSVSHNRIGDVLRAQGDGPGALTAFRKGLAIAEALAARDPANTQWQRDLSVSHNRIGDVLGAQGDGPGALAAYRKSLAIAEALAARDPANTQWQRDLSVSHNKIGDVLVAQGDAPGALAAYRKSLAIAEALAARDPANTQWQRDLSISHDGIGDVLGAQGDAPGALAAYRNSLAIRETLAARDPANTEWQRDLSVSHNKIGDVLVAQGDAPGALAAYRKSLAIAEALAARDPANTQWQRDLSVSHEKIGEVLGAQGDGPGALAAYRNSLAIRETLAARDPANTAWQRDLSVSHEKIGEVLGAQGDGPGALAANRNSLAIRETLAARDPANTAWQRDLSVSFMKIGDALVQMKRGEEARPYFDKAEAISDRLARLDPSNATWRNDLQWVREQIEALRGR